MSKKKPEPDPIEKAIGNRATPKKADLSELPENAILNPIPQNPSEIPDEPSPSEMLTLEELNRQAEARLQEQWPEIPNPTGQESKIKMEIPVSPSDPQPVTQTSSQESPPQKIETEAKELPPLDMEDGLLTLQQKRMEQELNTNKPPAEDVELTALKKYILDDGFVLATVSFHIVTLCAEPMTTPSTTTWDFVDRAKIPDMVLALLNQPGYLEGIWPSLRIVMGSNKGNAAWTAGIATTIAFFDVIRTLPAIEELKSEEKKINNLGL